MDYRGTPASKVLLASCVGLTVLAASNRVQHALFLGDRAALFERGEAWRLFTSLLPSESLAEGLVSWFLLYRFRVFERQMGTAKFVAFSLLAFAWAVATNAALVAVPFWRSGVAAGPYALIGALFVYYYRALPSCLL